MKPTTIASLQKCKQDKKRFATITAYDYSFAKLFAEEGLNVMLVGGQHGVLASRHGLDRCGRFVGVEHHHIRVAAG